MQGAASVHAIRQREHVFLLRLEPGDRRLEHLDQSLVEQRDAGWRLSVLRISRHEREMRGLAGDTERLQVLAIVGIGCCARNIGDRLGCLSDRYVCDHRVGCGVDCRERVGILEPDIYARAVAGRPHAVRKIADRDGCDLRKILGAEYLDFVQATDRDIGKRSLCRMGEVHVVGDRAGVNRLKGSSKNNDLS